jgi:hypothetical protein
MAIVTIALPVTGIRGTIAGVVFSANRSGPFAKGWRPCTRTRTPNQLTQRGYVAQLGALWRTLTPAEQGDWDTFAAAPPETDYNSLNEVYLLSGFGWFSRIWLRRKRAGEVEDLLAPAATPTAPPATFGLELHVSTGLNTDATFDFSLNEFQTYVAVLQLSIAPGVGTNVQTTRYLNQWECYVFANYSQDFGVAYWDSFGCTQIGQRFFAQLYRQSSSGIRSTPLTLYTEVVA